VPVWPLVLNKIYSYIKRLKEFFEGVLSNYEFFEGFCCKF
jgi:hypothetical protein